MTADKERVVTILRQRFGLDEPQALELADRAEELFLTETKRNCVPDRAFWLWVDLATELRNVDTGKQSEVVSAIKRGDTNITFATGQDSGLPGILSRMQAWRVARAK